MKNYQAYLILFAIILGIPALLFGLFYAICRIGGLSNGDSVEGAIGITIVSLYILYQIWKESPLNAYEVRKRKIIQENLETWNRLHRKECKKFDREEAAKIFLDDYPGPTSNPNAAGYFGNNPFGGFGS